MASSPPTATLGPRSSRAGPDAASRWSGDNECLTWKAPYKCLTWKAPYKLPPGPARPAVLLGVPLAPAGELQAGAVDDEVHGTVRDGLGPPPREAAAAPAQGGVVRAPQVLSEQPEHAGAEALGLAQGEVEDEP